MANARASSLTPHFVVRYHRADEAIPSNIRIPALVIGAAFPNQVAADGQDGGMALAGQPTPFEGGGRLGARVTPSVYIGRSLHVVTARDETNTQA